MRPPRLFTRTPPEELGPEAQMVKDFVDEIGYWPPEGRDLDEYRRRVLELTTGRSSPAEPAALSVVHDTAA